MDWQEYFVSACGNLRLAGFSRGKRWKTAGWSGFLRDVAGLRFPDTLSGHGLRTKPLLGACPFFGLLAVAVEGQLSFRRDLAQFADCRIGNDHHRRAAEIIGFRVPKCQ